MHIKLLVLLALVSVVRSHDVFIGSDGGRKIFEDTRFASPAIWRQVENVTVIAPGNEVISKVNITDMRADKDGDVDIVNGGAGEKSVTIEIKSPTVLRGYEFHIEVFSVPESNYKNSENADKVEDMPENILNNEYKTTTPTQNSEAESSSTNSNIPTSMEKESDVLRSARQTNSENDNSKLSEETETTVTPTETLYSESTTTENYPSTTETEENNDRTTESVEGSGDEENSATVIPSDWLRPARETDSEIDLTEIPVETEAEITTTETFNEEYTTIDYIPDDGAYNQDSTTEVLEVVPIDPAIRPVRETNDENESTATTTESLNKETTEGTMTTDDDIMGTPNTYVNSKFAPDYSALSILDYIKNREQGNRQTRRIEHSYDETESPDVNQNNDNSPPASEDSNSTNENDDTVDLVPPKIDAPYNDNFSPDLESTEEPIESSTTDVTTTAADEDSTPMSKDATTESSLEEKSRNSRNTEDNLENSNNFDLTSEAEPNDEPNSVSIKDNISTGIVLLKGDKVIITADGKQVEFTLPIVLIIGNENNFPMFKLVEDSTNIEKKDSDAESSLDDTLVEDSTDIEKTDLDAESSLNDTLVEDSTDTEKKDLDAESSLNDTSYVTMDYDTRDVPSDVAKSEEYSY